MYSRNTLLAMLASLVLAGCGIFSSDESEQPRELVDFESSVELEQLWSTRVGNGQGDLFRRLAPALDGDTLYVASADGTVMAVDRETGETRWRQRTEQRISGGVGASRGMVLFGTRDARVFALSQEDGSRMWDTRVSSEVQSAPRTDGRIVALQTVDGKLIALEAATGEQRWIHETSVPPLTLRGTSTPVIEGNLVMAGFSNGMLAAVDAGNGLLQWEQRVAVPQGRYDLERVIDIDGDLLLNGGIVYAASFQGNVLGLDTRNGQPVWGEEASSYLGLATGLGNVYYVNDSSHVIALGRNDVSAEWENDDLRLRQLTAPAATGNYLAVGDFEGYVHILSQINGTMAGRARVDRDGIRAPIVARRGVLYVYGNSGRLRALRIDSR
ncbi:MAG: outer membrane protein assembly factor BamB [Pseudohongiellaceae bacterium]